MPTFVGGVFQDRGQAERVIHQLLETGLPSSEISLVAREYSEEDLGGRAADQADNPFAELAVQAAWERLGWQGGARPAYRDRVPPNIEMAFLAAGPIAIAIGGAQLGAASGGLVGAMNNFGFPLDLGRQIYDLVRQGRAWVMVRTSPKSLPAVRETFSRYQPELHTESVRNW